MVIKLMAKQKKNKSLKVEDKLVNLQNKDDLVKKNISTGPDCL